MNYIYIKEYSNDNIKAEIANCKGLAIDKGIEIQETVIHRIGKRGEFGVHPVRKLKKMLRSSDVIIFNNIAWVADGHKSMYELIKWLWDNGIEFYCVASGFKLDGDMKTLEELRVIGAMTTLYELSRESMAKRIKVGWGDYVPQGRPIGAKSSILDKKRHLIVRWLKQGLKRVEIQEKLGCSRQTLYRFIKDEGLA